METTIVYWGYIWIMEKKMETTIVHSRSCSGNGCNCAAIAEVEVPQPPAAGGGGGIMLHAPY